MSTINKNISKENQELIDWIEKNQPVFPEKYYGAQKDMLIENVAKLWAQSPDIPIKQVLITILSPLPDFLPAENLIDVTKLVTEEWKKHQQKKAA